MNEQEKVIQPEQVLENIIAEANIILREVLHIAEKADEDKPIFSAVFEDRINKWLESSPPAKETQTDEQLQKEVKTEAERFYPYSGLSDMNTTERIRQAKVDAHIAAASPLQALLKEKEETIVCIERNYQQLLNAYEEMKAFTDKAIKEKDAKIESLTLDLQTLREGNKEWLKINTDAFEQVVAELKEENERLKGEITRYEESDLKTGIEWTRRAKIIDDLYAEIDRLRALHTQQMEEAWDAAVSRTMWEANSNIYNPPPNKESYLSSLNTGT